MADSHLSRRAIVRPLGRLHQEHRTELHWAVVDANESCLRVVVVESQPATAAGVVAFLTAADCEVVATIDDIRSLKPVLESVKVDVVVFDPTMVGPANEPVEIWVMANGVTVPMLAFTNDISMREVHRLLEAGVMGVVPRTASPVGLVQGVLAVAGGTPHLHPLVVTAWLHGVQSNVRIAGDIEFSGRENRVLELIADGSTNAAIAAQLGVSASTVKSLVGALLTKLDASDRANAVSIALRRGLIS